MFKRLLAVSLIAVLLLTGCDYTDAWVQILNGDSVKSTLEAEYQVAQPWVDYALKEAQKEGGEEARLELQERIGYNKVQVSSELNYKKKEGKLEVVIHNTFNAEKTKRMKFYVEGAKIYVPAELILDHYLYYWDEEERKLIEEAMQGKDYVIINMNEAYHYSYAFERMMIGSSLIPTGEQEGKFEEVFWTKKGSELERLMIFFKNLDLGIKKEGQSYVLDMNLSQTIDQSEKVVTYIIDHIKKEDKDFLRQYYYFTDEDFEELLNSKEEIKGYVSEGYSSIRESIESYGLKPIFDQSTIKVKWHLLKGTNQELELKVIVPADLMITYVPDGPQNQPLIVTSKIMQNINKDGTVDIEFPNKCVSEDEFKTVYDKIKKKREEKYEEMKKQAEAYEEEEDYSYEDRIKMISYFQEKDLYYYSVRELSHFFEEEISYKNDKLYFKRGGKKIEIKHQMLGGRAYVERAVLESLGYSVETEEEKGYYADEIRYFFISKGDQSYIFEGEAVK